MAEVKITDLVPQETIDKVKELNDEMQSTLTTYTNVAKELAKGIHISVQGLDDIDKLQNLLAVKSKEASAAADQFNGLIDRQREIIGQTTNVRSRELMEIERKNKLTREEYTSGEKVTEIVTRLRGNYEQQIKTYNELGVAIEANKKKRDELTKSYKNGSISEDQYLKALQPLVIEERNLKQAKADLQRTMKIEEKLNDSNAGSYRHLAQQLELMKDTYKDLDETQKNSEAGKEMERMIQELDAHLKDRAARMGEFQRNVGNYAIAGQNGVVATESLMAAMNQEAQTQQDLIDQTKILEEAKLMLNKNDADYQTTLDKLNAKLEENKSKLTDVSDIIGKEAKTVSEAEAQNKRLTEAIKHLDLTSEDAKKKLEEMRAQIRRNNDTIANATGSNEKFAESMLTIIGINANFGASFQSIQTSGSFIDGLDTKVKALGKTLLGLLANPVVLTFLGIAGVAAGFKWWYDYNKGLIEASRLTENFTGKAGEAADKVTADMQTMAEHMGKGYDATIGAANTLVQQFGVSWEDAGKKMQDGIVAGADMSGNLLANIERFGPAMRDAGVSADEFMAILSETRNGIFNEQGIQNIIKAGTRLRAMTKQTEEALDSVGISAQKMQNDLESGQISMLDAVKQVAAKLKELPENSQEAGQIMKNVFGRTASEGGTLLIQSIADINTNIDKAKENMGELGKANERQLNAQRELNETLMAVFKASGTSFEVMIADAKTFVTEGLTMIIKRCADVVNWFVRMYNEAAAFRYLIALVISLFDTLYDMIKGVTELGINGFKAIGNIIKGFLMVLSGDIQKGYEHMINSVIEGYKNFAKIVLNTGAEIGKDFAENFNKAADQQLKPLKVEIEGDNEESKGTVRNTGGSTASGSTKAEESGGSDKEAAKRIKEELKLIQQLEESKIAIMEEGHEKELATIRLKFKKKLDEITGNGETEMALRLQLAEECEKEVADCELKYQRELSKINLENRLASVREGSREELDLKLAQLEAQRDAEVESAKKTGADVDLINEKFNRQREKLQEDYADKYVAIMQNRFSVEQILRDRAYVDEVNALKQKYAEELAAANGNQTKMEEIRRQYDDALFTLDEKYAKESAAATVDMYETLLDTEGLSMVEREKLRAELMRAKMDMSAMEADYEMQNAERVTQKEQEELEKRKAAISQWLNVAADGLNAINGLAQAIFDSKIQRIEEEQEANTEAGEKEQERISELVSKKVITEEEGEARKRAAAAQTQKKDEELENKKAKLKQKQAVWDKANSLAQAGIATALAITQALPNLVLAAIAGAMGAVQIATILATPIPKYAKGTDYHKGGPAIVGDGGRPEVVVFDNKMWLTPDKPTLVDIPKGASVIPDVTNIISLPPQTALPPMTEQQIVVSSYNDRNIIRSVEELGRLIKQQTRMQQKTAYQNEFEIFKSKI